MFNEGGSIMTWLISVEARKHRAFREVWVAYLLGGLYLLLGAIHGNFGPELQRAL